MSTFYTTYSNINNYFDKNSRKMEFSADSVEAFENWKAASRAKLREISGIDTMQTCMLNPELIESREFEGYRRDKMLIQTEPDVFMPFYVFIPAIKRDKYPVLINPHGHGGGKDIYSGAVDIPLVNEILKSKSTDPDTLLPAVMARSGYIVFCPDARGAGERREGKKQTDDFVTGNSHYELNNIAISLGRSLAGMLAWDLMRLTDYVETRDDTDTNRIYCAGFSGGGQQTLWLAALDDRIKRAITGGYFYGVKESFLELPQNCACNFVPNFWLWFDIGDLGAMIAPRPLYIENGRLDHLNGKSGLDNVYPQVETARRAYSLFGAEDNVWHEIHEGGHVYVGARVREFLEA